MAERMFNPDQEAYMRDLGTIPRAERCACGWARLGKCAHPSCVRAYATAQAGPATAQDPARREIPRGLLEQVAAERCPPSLAEPDCPPCQANRELERRWVEARDSERTE